MRMQFDLNDQPAHEKGCSKVLSNTLQDASRDGGVPSDIIANKTDSSRNGCTLCNCNRFESRAESVLCHQISFIRAIHAHETELRSLHSSAVACDM